MIQEMTRVRRETISGDLKAAEIPILGANQIQPAVAQSAPEARHTCLA